MARQQQPIVNHAGGLDHAVWRHPLDDQMARLCHPVVRRGQPSNRAEMQGLQLRNPRDSARAEEPPLWLLGFGAPAPAMGAFGQQGVDPVLGVTSR